MRTMFGLCAVCTLVALAGCGESKVPTIPVTGKILYKKSTPAAGALVVFHPVDDDFERLIGGKPFAYAKDDGTFALTLREEGDGAPEGDYNVTVVWHKKVETKFSLSSEGGPSGPQILNPKYGNPKSPVFKFSVKKGEPNDFTLEVD